MRSDGKKSSRRTRTPHRPAGAEPAPEGPAGPLEEKTAQLASLNEQLRAEVAERKRIESALRESEKLLQTVIDTEPECVKMLAADGTLLLMNKAGLAMIQADSLNQVKGRCVYPLIAPEYREAFRRITEEAFTGGSGTLEFEMTGLHGRSLWLDTRAAPLRNEEGGIIAVLGITRDITERKKAVLRLQRESLLNACMEALSRKLLLAESVQDIADLTLEEAQRLTDSRYGYVGYIDAATGHLIAPTLTRDIWDQCKVSRKAVVFEKFTGLWGWVLVNRKPLLTNVPAGDPRSTGIPKGHIPITRFLSVPAVIGDELLGQISVANAERDYTEEDRLVLERLASLFGLGIRRKQAEEALREEEKRFRALFEGAPDAIFLADIKTGRIIDANPAACGLLRMPREKVIGLHQSDLHPPRLKKHARETFQEHIERSRAMKAVTPVESAVQRQDGAEVPVEVLAHVISLQGRQVLYGIFRDITERKKGDEALRRSEQRYKELLGSVTSYIYTVKVEDGRAVSTTHGPGCAAVNGYTTEEFAADPYLWYRMIYDADKALVLEQASRMLAGQAAPIEHRLVHKDGSIVWIRNTPVPRFDGQGRLVSYDGLITNITERKRNEEFIRNILETVDEGFIVINADYTILSANRAYCAQLGRTAEEVVGRKCHEVTHGISRPCREHGEDCAVQRTFETGRPSTAVHTHHDRNGNAVAVETKSYPVRDDAGRVTAAIEVVNNITEKKRLEAQLRHAQKMEAVGLLAGGIAHDFNNVLTAVIGYGSLLQMKLPPDNPLRSYVEQILAATARAAALTRSLLAFSRKQTINPRPVDLNEIIHRIEKLLHRVIGEDVELRTGLAPAALTILADSSQIEQVLMNLATNARDAMPRGGVLTIGTGAAVIDEAFRKFHGFGKDGTYAAVTVTDTGVGMDEQTRQRIFDPFFTTKEMGKGTGLGLAIVYGIMKQNGGYVIAASEVGKGSVFTLYFPLIESPAEPEPPAEPAAVLGGPETILIAEDDAELRTLTATMLAEFGYTVIEAEDGEDAVRKFAQAGDDVQLVILDAVMPKKSGRDAYQEIIALKPAIKALFISGYGAEIIGARGLLVEGVPVMLKPTSPTELLRTVRRVLDFRGAKGS